jgi:hypothetical protein
MAVAASEARALLEPAIDGDAAAAAGEEVADMEAEVVLVLEQPVLTASTTAASAKPTDVLRIVMPSSRLQHRNGSIRAGDDSCRSGRPRLLLPTVRARSWGS